MAHAQCTQNTEGYKHTLSQHIIINALAPQQRLHERVSVIRYMQIARLG